MTSVSYEEVSVHHQIGERRLPMSTRASEDLLVWLGGLAWTEPCLETFDSWVQVSATWRLSFSANGDEDGRSGEIPENRCTKKPRPGRMRNCFRLFSSPPFTGGSLHIFMALESCSSDSQLVYRISQNAITVVRYPR